MAAYKNEDLYRVFKELQITDITVLDKALKTAKTTNSQLGEVLLKDDIIESQNLGRIVGDMIATPYIDLSNVDIPESVLKIIPEIVAEKQRIIAFKKDENGLHLAMADPSKTKIKEFISKKTGLSIITYYALDSDVQNALQLYAKDVKKAFSDIISENIEKAKGSAKAEPPIIRIVDTILDYAYENRASDVHVEPYEKFSLVRFRVDGLLHDVVELPLDLHPRLVTRIKVLASLRTDEHQAAQDLLLKVQL